tara:strand:+ start:872 stop:1021 length:150 start_codon:yes stop_codon:yes gene_type:complete
MKRFKRFLQVAIVTTIPAWVPTGCEQQYLDNINQPKSESVQRFVDTIKL